MPPMILRSLFMVVVVCALSREVRAQRPTRPAPRDEAGALVRTALDTSVIYRAVARQQLLRASAEVRAEALKLLVQEISAPAPGRQNRALGMLCDFGSAARVAVDPVIALLRDLNENVRYSAISALRALGPTAAPAAGILRELANGQNAGLAESAAEALLAIGDSVPAHEAFLRLLSSSLPMWLRVRMAAELGEMGDPIGVPFLRAALADTSISTKAGAVAGLAALGPLARSAVPDLMAMLSDMTPRWWPDVAGVGDYESAAALAAWALPRIIPTSSSGGGGFINYPMHAWVMEGHNLRRRTGGLRLGR